ncbi:TPA: CS1-pili formation C-terminal domain-containing protein [Klebsiella aerogenes]|nr:CS1-pili formation C-terminal domain-containing protein [Klebsiella aerogenes]HDU4786752.1 CS1-pili formation C-terminal domain-containing protein [Klebsiella aerogenes]
MAFHRNALLFVVLLPASVQLASATIVVPAGFEDLAKTQRLWTEVSLYGASLGLFEADITLETVTFVAPETLIAAIKRQFNDDPALIASVTAALSSPLARNGNLACSSNGSAAGCDFIDTKSVALIYDENNARINLFFDRRYLPKQTAENQWYQPTRNTENALIHQQNINFVADEDYQSMTVQGNGALAMTENGYFNLDWTWLGQRSRHQQQQEITVNNAWFRQDLWHECDDRHDNGLPWESVYMTRSRSQAWQAGLSNAFSTRGLNINSSINLFMRNDHSGDGKDKGGFLSVSLSLAHNRQGDASSYTSVGATWQQQKHEKNQLNYNVAHNWYTDARGENEYGLNASGINSDSLNTSAYTRQGGRFGNGSLTVSDSWDRQDHRHRFSSSGNYSSTLALSRSGLWFGRWGDGRPASAIAVNVATPEASPDSRIAVSLDNSGSADIPANARALFALPGYQQTTLTINESTDISHGANSEITQGSGSRTVFMVPGKMLHREVQTTTRYTWLGQLTDEQHTPFIGGMPLNVSGWSDLGNGGFSAESDSLIQSLYLVKQQQFYQCALKVKTIRDVVRYVGTVTCEELTYSALPETVQQQAQLLLAGRTPAVSPTAMNNSTLSTGK